MRWETIMYQRILIPSDHSQAGTKAVKHGVELAKRLGSKLTILDVLQPFHMFSFSPEMLTETPDEHTRHLRDQAEIGCRRAEQEAKAAGLECQTIEAVHDHLGQARVETAEARGCDLIVMPSHARHGFLG